MKQDLKKFEAWLIGRGRDEKTAELYRKHLNTILAAGEISVKRLLDKNLAPLTRRSIKASLKAWAKYTKNTELIEQLDDIKLPPARRVGIKIPLEKSDWKKLRKEIDTYELTPEVAVIGMMATRGFRVGDVLRMTRSEVKEAVDSGTLAITVKGGRRLEFGVTDAYRRYLEALLTQPKWKQMEDLIPNKMRVRRTLKEIATEAGLDASEIYPHRLRRTVATYFLESVGGDLTKLKDWMGWTNINTAASYTDFHKKKDLDDAAAKMFEDD